MNEINICLLTDNDYIMQTCVAITSIVENKAKESFYNIYILCDMLLNDNIKKIMKLEKEKIKINIIELNSNGKYLQYAMDVPASPTAIYKFSIPKILDKLDKVLYLDGDIIVKKDLCELYNCGLENNYIGAVKDTIGLSKSLYRLFMNQNAFYFNSGVLLMNLKKMRNDNVTEKLLEYRKKEYNELMDQDALNYVLRGKVKELSFLYNMQTLVSKKTNLKNLKKYYELTNEIKNFDDIINNAVVVHFAGTKKPWKHFGGYGYDLWMNYFRKSPFKDEELKKNEYEEKKKFKIKYVIKKIRRYKFMKNFTK